MFYSQFILAKKGPLGTIWIAAHLERKLRKNQVADTDIGVSVDSILFPEMPIALRLSSHLLLGVVRIYSRKVNYLFDDCSEALLKVKQAFRSRAVDLPPEESTAPYHSITLPETFDLDDFELPDNDIFQGSYVDHHVSSRDQITLQDTMEGVVYSTSKFGLDERFGDGDASGLDLDEELLAEKAASAGDAGDSLNSDVDPQASFQARAPLKHYENQDALTVSEAILPNGGVNQIEDFDGDNEPVEYAQAPSTPGLWEEPNLSNIQETSACDDHQEPENHNVTESAVNKKIDNVSCKVTEHVPHKQEDNHFEPKEKSAPPVIATKDMSMDDIDSTCFTDPSVLDTIITMTHGPEGVEDVLDENAMGKEPGVQSVDDNRENWVEVQGNLENSCHLTTQMESNAETLGEDDIDNPKDQALREPEDSKISTLSGSLLCSDSLVFRPCITHLNHSDTIDKNHADPVQLTDVASLHSLETSAREEPPNAYGNFALMQGEGSHATYTMESNLQEIHVTEPGLHDEDQVACNLSNEQSYNITQGDNINSYTSDFPAAEKLLSVPERFSDVVSDVLLESTPAQEDIVRGDGGYSGSDMLTGKKRSFTESSLMTQSFNLVESSGLFTTKITVESVPDDDDLLSSILVGRSSVLKVKSTPPPEVPSKRRRQSAPRTGVAKRKVPMDDNMVLHGDTIRQQLTNTEDIRRLRKKAPCTWFEISMIQKQFWEDDLFDETLFTGVSIKLASLHNQSYDLSRIRVSQGEASSEGATVLKSISQNDENVTHLETGNEKLGASLEPNVPEENLHEANLHPLANEDFWEAEPFEMPPLPSNQPYENNTTNSYYYDSQEQMHATSEVTEPTGSEHELFRQRTAMKIDGKNFSVDVRNSVVPIEVESLTCTTDAVPRDTGHMPVALDQVEKTTEAHASLQMAASGIQSDEKMDLLSVGMDSSMDTGKYFDTNIGEMKVDTASLGEISETKHELVVVGAEDGTSMETLTGLAQCLESRQVANASCTFPFVTDSLRPDIVTLDHDMEEIKKNEEEFVNEEKTLQPQVDCNAKNLVTNGSTYGEELAAVTAYKAEVTSCSKDVLLDDKEISGHQDAYPAATTNTEDNSSNNRVDGDELEYSAVGNDTDFLNFDDDDDEEVEAASDYLTNTEAKRFIDNSGWSSRTKAVAKYLQIMFDRGERGRMLLPVNSLLAGKTRKEASRMFFETLVLKTKDYIHVEQRDPFENIDILPRSKLFKSDI